jgi:ketosteroid isomerase-like protein
VSDDILNLIRNHYAAYARGDTNALLEGLDPAVVIRVANDHGVAEGDPVRGRDGAEQFFKELSSLIVDRSVTVESLRQDRNRVLAKVRLGGTLKATGESGEIFAVHLFSVHDGLISEIRTHRPDWRRYAEGD